MRYCLFTISFIFLLSCKKKEEPLNINLNDTRWNLYYKYDGFSFFAQTEIRFHGDNTFENIGVSDTVYGTWTNSDSIRLYFDNNAYFKGMAVSNDSLTGTMRNAATNGVWSAGRK